MKVCMQVLLFHFETTIQSFFFTAKTMVDSNGMEVDETNPFIARKLERIRAEKLVDHTFMRKLLSKKISITEVP